MFEMYWASYFVREAQMMAQCGDVSEEQREKQDFATRLYPIPKELGIVFRKRENRKGVVGLWEVWHREKRADMY